MVEVMSSSDIDAGCYIIIRKLLGSIANIQWGQNSHTGDLVEYAGFLLHKVACSRNDMLSKMFETRYNIVT
jgi:hypothetical protein